MWAFKKTVKSLWRPHVLLEKSLIGISVLLTYIITYNISMHADLTISCQKLLFVFVCLPEITETNKQAFTYRTIELNIWQVKTLNWWVILHTVLIWDLITFCSRPSKINYVISDFRIHKKRLPFWKYLNRNVTNGTKIDLTLDQSVLTTTQTILKYNKAIFNYYLFFFVSASNFWIYLLLPLFFYRIIPIFVS